MKKLLALVPAITGAAWAGTTLVAGNQAEPAYNDVIAQLNQSSPVPLVVESYEKGYLSSTAITKVMSSSDQDAEVIVRLKHEIDHSTIGLDSNGARVGKSTILTTLVLDEANDPDMQKLAAAFNGADPIVLASTVGIDGASDNTLLLNPAALKDQEAEVMIAGGEIRFTINRDQAIEADGNIAPISVINNVTGDSIKIAAGALEFDLLRDPSGLYSGTQNFSLDALSVNNPNQGVMVDLKAIKLDTNTVIDDTTVGGTVEWSLGNKKSPLPIDSAQMSFEMQGLSVDAIAKYQQLSRASLNSSNSMNGLTSENLIEIIAGILRAGMSIDWNVKADNSGGSVIGDLNLGRLDGAPDLTVDATIRDFLLTIAGKVTLDADAAALDMLPIGTTLQVPPATDYITYDGAHYRGEAILSDNVITLNNNPLPIDLMLGGVLDMTIADALQMAR